VSFAPLRVSFEPLVPPARNFSSHDLLLRLIHIHEIGTSGQLAAQPPDETVSM
jgi:hypothetical protein